MTAAAAVWKDPDNPDNFVLETCSWLPREGLEEKSRLERTPWIQWADKGFVVSTPGEIVDWTYPMNWIQQKDAVSGVNSMAYDPWKINQFKREIERYGVVLSESETGAPSPQGAIRTIPHPQGFIIPKKAQNNKSPAMPFSIDLFEDLLLSGRIKILYNPCLRVAAQGIRIIQDGKRNKTTTRLNSRVKIDNLVASIMAVGLAGIDKAQAPTKGPLVFSAKRLAEGEAYVK